MLGVPAGQSAWGMRQQAASTGSRREFQVYRGGRACEHFTGIKAGAVLVSAYGHVGFPSFSFSATVFVFTTFNS